MCLSKLLFRLACLFLRLRLSVQKNFLMVIGYTYQARTNVYSFQGDPELGVFWSQCYRQWLYRAPLCITLKIKIWVVAYLKSIIFFPSKNFFAHKKLKKPPSKVTQKNSNSVFFPYCQHSPKGPNRRIHVPKCGL